MGHRINGRGDGVSDFFFEIFGIILGRVGLRVALWDHTGWLFLAATLGRLARRIIPTLVTKSVK